MEKADVIEIIDSCQSCTKNVGDVQDRRTNCMHSASRCEFILFCPPVVMYFYGHGKVQNSRTK